MSTETGQRILDAALTCAQAGPDFSMADVAAKAGLSRQAAYLHFPDRAALLTSLQAHARQELDPAAMAQAPSARAALSDLIARLADDYPKLWPVLRAAGGETEAPERLALCQALAGRFREEGALAPHLSPATAADLLFSLMSPSVWHALVGARSWDAGRYRSHIGYLAMSALTR